MGTHNALGEWLTTRKQFLDSLAHARNIIATEHGGTSAVAAIDRILFPALAAEFQGFCRNLHSEAVADIVAGAAWQSPRLRKSATTAMENGRGLDRGNPSPTLIATDFHAIGLPLWQTIQEEHPVDYPVWRSALTTLIGIRNAVSHSDQDRIDDFADRGHLTFMYWLQTRATLHTLAVAMDTAVTSYLKDLATVHTSHPEGPGNV